MQQGPALKGQPPCPVTLHKGGDGWRPPHHDRPDYYPGALRRAEELGYRVEHFWYNEEGMTPRRFADILLHRNITGLLIGRLPPGRHTLELPWEQFAAVALGMTLQAPLLNHVAEDAFASACQMIERCQAKGYRRIGLVFSDDDDSPAMGYRYMSAYLGYQALQQQGIPPLKYHGQGAFDTELREWQREHRPEAIIATHAAPVARALDKMGLRGAQPPVLALVNDKPEQGFAGMHLDASVLGTLAVEMLVGMLYRGEKGLPANPHQVLVQGKWVEPRTEEQALQPAKAGGPELQGHPAAHPARRLATWSRPLLPLTACLVLFNTKLHPRVGFPMLQGTSYTSTIATPLLPPTPSQVTV